MGVGYVVGFVGTSNFSVLGCVEKPFSGRIPPTSREKETCAWPYTAMPKPRQICLGGNECLGLAQGRRQPRLISESGVIKVRLTIIDLTSSRVSALWSMVGGSAKV